MRPKLSHRCIRIFLTPTTKKFELKSELFVENVEISTNTFYKSWNGYSVRNRNSERIMGILFRISARKNSELLGEEQFVSYLHYCRSISDSNQISRIFPNREFHRSYIVCFNVPSKLVYLLSFEGFIRYTFADNTRISRSTSSSIFCEIGGLVDCIETLESSVLVFLNYLVSIWVTLIDVYFFWNSEIFEFAS